MPVDVTTLTSDYGTLTYKCYKIGKLVAVMAQLVTNQEVPKSADIIIGLPYAGLASNYTPINVRDFTNAKVITLSLRRSGSTQNGLFTNDVIPSGASIRMNFVYAIE